MTEELKPCSHPGCLHHVTHPCEGCGRIAGRRPAPAVLSEEEIHECWKTAARSCDEHRTVLITFARAIESAITARFAADLELTCTWTAENDDYNSYRSDCGGHFCIEEGTPEENNMTYCTYCGRKLIDAALRDGGRV